MKGTHKNNDENDECDNYRKGPLDVMIFNKFNWSPGEIRVNMPSELKKGTAIYRLKLEKEDNGNYVLAQNTTVTRHYSDSVSGICRFVEDLVEASEYNDEQDKQESKKNIKNQEKQLKRFIILNFHGIYNFEFNSGFESFDLNEKYSYPKSIRRELNIGTLTDCMAGKLLTCLYGQYFLVERYKNNVQSLEGIYNNL